VRHAGSGNIGATNVARTAGRGAALVTLAGDVAKGLVPVLLARRLAPGPWALAGVGIAAVVGHVYSVWVRFSGGKGVATACGVFLGMAPLALAPAVGVFITVVLVTRYVSLASVAAEVALPLAGAVFGYATPVLASASCVALLIVLRHRDNLSRLLNHSEPRFQVRRYRVDLAIGVSSSNLYVASILSVARDSCI